MYGVDEVSIYEWKNEKFRNKIQDIQIQNPRRCNTFAIHNITYIACGREFAAQRVPVLKWSEKEFEPFQDLPSSNVFCRPISSALTAPLPMCHYSVLKLQQFI